MKLPRYSKYKESGVEWLGEVPAHWHVAPLKRGFAVKLGKMLQPAQACSTDLLLPYLRAANLQWGGVDITDIKEMWFSAQERDSLLIRIGDLLVSEGGDVGRSTVWQGELPECFFQNSVNRVRPRFSNSNSFLFYWIRALKDKGYIDVLCNKSTIAHFTAEKVAEVPVPYPHIVEQHAIATFLDRETAKIDALIAEQERLIELLTEKRQAVISHAVTKGLNPDAPMKDSGIEWLGEVPRHWEVLEIKKLAKEREKAFTDGDWVEAPYITDSGIRLLQTGNVGRGHFKEQGYKYISELSFDELGCTEIFPGDVLICRLDGPVGRACLVPSLPSRMITSVDNTILKTDSKVDPRFVVYVLNTPEWIGWLDAICRVGGGHRVRVSRSMLGTEQIALPPHREQVRIADMLDSKGAAAEQIITEAKRAISLLHERRIALISAAVTGKIDVRGLVPEISTTTEEAASAQA